MGILANSSDISTNNFMNKNNNYPTKNITSAMLRAVIYWIWNLKPEQVVFDEDAKDLCLNNSITLSKAFGYAVEIPLVIPSDMRKKLARVSAAFAGILLSSDDTFSKLIIKKIHVEMATNFLNLVYSADNCQLNDYSEIQREGSQLVDFDLIDSCFTKKINNEKHNPIGNERGIFVHLLHILRCNDIIKRDELVEQIGCSKITISNEISLLRKYSLIESTRDGYKKRPKFNRFLRRFLKLHPEFVFKNEDIDDSIDEKNKDEPDLSFE